MWDDHKRSLGHSLDNYVAKYGPTEGPMKHLEWKASHKGKGSLEWFIQHYGPDEGPEKYKEKNSRLSVGASSLQKRGYSAEQIQKIRRTHALKSRVDKEALQFRYGEAEGARKHAEASERKRLNSKRGLAFWLNVHQGDKAAAAKSLADYQRKDYTTFTRLYGPEKGPELYSRYVERKTRNWRVQHDHSEGQLELEAVVRTWFPSSIVKGDKERYAFFLKKAEQDILGQRVIFPDIVATDLGFVIEYFGDYWHCHPSLFPDPNAVHKSIPGKTAEQIRERDALKAGILEARGYRTFVVWEHDWHTDRSATLARLSEAVNAYLDERNFNRLHG